MFAHHPDHQHGSVADLVVVSNRLPVRRVRERDQMTWKTSPGGLVSALTPVLSKRRGAWIGWCGHHGSTAPDSHLGIGLVSVALSRQDVKNYYHGFSNSSLWPLYHDAIRPAEFSDAWWQSYRDVNKRFAEAVAERAPHGAVVWIQDYHLHLLPALLRRLRGDVKIGFFLHIPFPPPELFQQLPWRDEMMEGLLGADLVGFHTQPYVDNFRRSALRLVGAQAHRDGLLVTGGGREVRLGAFPISIDTAAFEALARDSRTRRAAARLRGKLGNRRVVLGADRLDYTKGIEQRLHAWRQLLEDGRVRADQCVLVQIAVPSREKIRDYAEQRAHVERLVGEINGRHGEPGRGAVHYVYRSLPVERLAAYYVAADVMAVTPLRDGMNLVAKEYVACRTDDDGVLLLSEFAGAAEELSAAELVNPHDGAGLAMAMARCLAIRPREAREPMRAMRRIVRAHDVHHWAASFLRALDGCSEPARAREREEALTAALRVPVG